MPSDRRSTPTWQWIAIMAVSIVIGVAGYAYTDTQAKIRDLGVNKADREVVKMMYNDVQDIKNMLTGHIIDTGAGRVSKRKINNDAP